MIISAPIPYCALIESSGRKNITYDDSGCIKLTPSSVISHSFDKETI
jgi:hypothetical protein